MSRKIPQDRFVIIIGAGKCGTSSLFEYLSSHPKVCPCSLKEPEYFSENKRHGCMSPYSKRVKDLNTSKTIIIDRYEDLWDYDETIHSYAMEASTGYSTFPHEQNVAKNIHEYGLEPKLIYIVRNPFDRIESQYNFSRRFSRADIITKYSINYSKYNLQLEQYRKYFNAENILVIDFDELKNNSFSLQRTVYDFLSLPDTDFPDKYPVVNSTSIDSKSKKRILTMQERNYIHKELQIDMSNLHVNYGIDVQKWGFDT